MLKSITPTLSTLAQWLKSKGWRKLPTSAAVLNCCDHLWQKKSNKKSNNLYKYGAFKGNENPSDNKPTSFAIELTAKAKDGYWVRYEKYGIRESELKDVLDSQVDNLITAWIAIN